MGLRVASSVAGKHERHLLHRAARLGQRGGLLLEVRHDLGVLLGSDLAAGALLLGRGGGLGVGVEVSTIREVSLPTITS